MHLHKTVATETEIFPLPPPRLSVCLSLYKITWKVMNEILTKLAGIVDIGKRKRWLHFGAGLDSGGTLNFDHLNLLITGFGHRATQQITLCHCCLHINTILRVKITTCGEMSCLAEVFVLRVCFQFNLMFKKTSRHLSCDWPLSCQHWRERHTSRWRGCQGDFAVNGPGWSGSRSSYWAVWEEEQEADCPTPLETWKQ